MRKPSRSCWKAVSALTQARRRRGRTFQPQPMPNKSSNKLILSTAAVLVLALVFVSIPAPKPAQALTACLTAVAGALGIKLGVKAAAGAGGAALGLYVPTFDIVNAPSFDITAVSTAGLKTKSCADEIMTMALKAAISMTRDMVLRWIITGRFEGPVFSQSFVIDAQRAAENASRTFLGRLTGINFCAGLPPIPPQAFFGLNIEFDFACTFQGDLTEFRLGRVSNYASLASSEQSTNEYWNLSMRALDQKLQYEEIARTSFREEYRAGQGFLCIKDPNTGKCTTPGSAVATLVMQSQIVSSIRQTDVADDVQTAIASIIDTAVRVFIERGLTAAFGS